MRTPPFPLLLFSKNCRYLEPLNECPVRAPLASIDQSKDHQESISRSKPAAVSASYEDVRKKK